MTNNEILKKAVIRAMENGFVPDSEWNSIPTSEHYLDKYIELKQYYSLIFNHEFCDAFFGKEEKYNGFIEIPYELSETKQQRKKLIIKNEFIKMFGKDNYTNFVEYDAKGCLSHKRLSKNKILKCFNLSTINIYEKKIPCTGWKYHLQQMVLSNEPLKYLEKFL